MTSCPQFFCFVAWWGYTDPGYAAVDDVRAGPVPARARQLMARLRLTLVLFGVVLLAGIVTGTIASEWFPRLMQLSGWDLRAFREGRLYTVWTGLLFSSQPGPRPTMLAILLLGVGALEYRAGSKATAVAFLLLGPLSSLLTILLLWPMDALGAAWVRPYLYIPDMGSSSASLLCWGAALTTLDRKPQVFLLITTTLVLVLLLVFVPKAYGADHLVAFPIGLATGHWLTRWAKNPMSTP